MGAGTGAKTNVDSKYLSWQAAVEQAEAEFRLQVAAQEDLKRQLLYLEEGGNYLDIRSGEGSSIGIQFTSPTDPLADQLLPSEGQEAASSVLVTSKNGHHVEDSMGTGTFVAKRSEAGDNLLLDSNSVTVSLKESIGTAVDIKSHSNWAIQIPSLVEGQQEFGRKEGDSSAGVPGGSRSQSYARKNRFRSNRYGNGHISQNAMERVFEGEELAIMQTSLQGCALSSDIQHIVQENEASFYDSYHTDSTKDQHVSSEYQNRSDQVTQEEKIGSVNGLSLVKDNQTWKDISLAQVSLEAVGRDLKTVRHITACVPQHRVSGPEGRDVSSCDGNTIHCASLNHSNLDVLPYTGIEALNANQSTMEMRNTDQIKLESVPASPLCGKMEIEHRIIHSDCKGSPANAIAFDKPPVDASISDGYSIISQGNMENIKAISDPKVLNNESSTVSALSKSTFGTAEHLHATKNSENLAVHHNESLLMDQVEASVQSKAGIVQVKLEDNLSNGKLSDLPPSVEASGLKDTNGIQNSVAQEAGTLEAHLQSNIMIHRGPSRLQGRLSSTASSAANKFPRVILPGQGERNPNVAAQAEKLKANISAATRKAHEEVILEDAEAIKVTEKHVAEWGRRKAAPEPLRRKSHWDFVLEEMAWMANDFMQERFWKTAVAAQISPQVSQGRYSVHPDANTLEKQQRKVASDIAKCVMQYWQLTASMLQRETGQESRRSNCADTGCTSEAVPMDVDNLTSRELAKEERNDKNDKDKISLRLQDYAFRFLHSSLSKNCISKTIGPLTPGRDCEAVVFENACEKKSPKESLFYVVPQGAFELYRRSVESDWATIEAEHEQTMQEQAAAFAEAEAQELRMGNESGLPSLDEIRSFISRSSPRAGLTGDTDELELELLSRNLDSGAGPNALIAKKKRKQIPRTMFKFTEAMPGVGSSLATPDTHITGKKSFNSSFGPNNMSVGPIPTKRMRTAAVAARQLATGGANSPISNAGIMGLAYRGNTSTRTGNSQQEDFLGLSDCSVLARTTEADISPKNCNLGASSDGGTYNAPKSKKKKKTKHFRAELPLSSIVDGHLYSAEKMTDSDYAWHQESHQQHEQKEQMKRKGDQLLQISSNNSSSDAGLETPGTPGSQGVAGHQPSKKVKLAKQSSDGNPDGVSIIAAAQVSPQIANALNTNKVSRQNLTRDRLRKNKAGKAPSLQASTSQPGAGIPWSSIEDQAIVALVHDLGPNWELVSDVLSLSSQLKGIFRKPKDCKERYKVLLERLSTDDGDSPDDFTSPQAHSSSFSGISKSSARMLLQRLQGPLEEDSLKTHFGHIVHIVQQDCARRHQIKHDSQEKQEILPVHISHTNAVSQFSSSSLTGGSFTPLDLCERPSLNGDVPTNAFTIQPANMNGMGFPALLAGGSGLRPSSAGLPLLPSLPMGPTLSPSSTAIHAARDAQRMAAAMRPLSTEEQRLRYTQMVMGRGMPQGTSSPGNISLMNFSHLSDSPVPVLPTASNGSMIGGLSIAMAVPRPGMQSMFPPGVPGMASTGLNGVLPPGGVMAGTADALMAGSGQFNLMRRSREALQMVRSGQCTEEQRQLLIQELQHHAAQGNNHAAAALNSLKGNLPTATVSSPKQAYSVQQHNTLAQPPQNSNHAYLAAVRMAKERQLQQQQHQQNRIVQHQLHQPNLVQPQTVSLPQQQHAITQQQQMQPQPQQLFSQQQQLQQQVAPTMPPLTLQQQPPQTMAPQTFHMSQSQQPQTVEQIGQHASQSKLQQQKQLQRHQQPQQQVLPTKGPKGVGRSGTLGLPSLPPQSGQSNVLTGQGMNQQSTQMASQTPHQMQGQRVLSAAGPVQPPKQLSPSQHGNSAEVMQIQEQAQGKIQAGILAPNAAAVAQQAKGLLLQPQPSSKQQQTQLPLQPSSSTGIQSQQQPLSSPLIATQLQPQLPAVSIPMLSQSPPPQSPQYQLRRQAQQPQPSHRRLQQRQASSNTGLQTVTSMGKTNLQTLVPSQVTSNSGPLPFHLGATASGPSNTGVTTPSAPHLSAISSGAHSTTWKPGQSLPPMSAGVHNLTRSNNPSTNQLSPTQQSPAGHYVVQSSAANPQRSLPPGTVGSAPVNGAGIISKQVPVVGTIAGPAVATSPTSSR
ncbi:hypothetical protein O6H91_10G022200 [Diphasiastrum complanatum]|uniref:Uncharacterized protein n=3 Tax=Diphasiastrum complanatum TaxID=34168 RepID=A0ACC2CEX8_DIPCM|nr:hypothetical protein O6H91_10G022200 [Diphasiastrum complanatum]